MFLDVCEGGLILSGHAPHILHIRFKEIEMQQQYVIITHFALLETFIFSKLEK